MPYSMEAISKAFTPQNIDKWEKTFSKKILLEKLPKQEENVESSIGYFYISCPFPMSDRDVIKKKMVHKNYGGDPKQILTVEINATHPKYPAKDDPVRANCILEGTLLKEKSPNETLMCVVTEMDLKVTTGKGIVDKKAPEAMLNMFKNLKKYLKKNH